MSEEYDGLEVIRVGEQRRRKLHRVRVKKGRRRWRSLSELPLFLYAPDGLLVALFVIAAALTLYSLTSAAANPLAQNGTSGRLALGAGLILLLAVGAGALLRLRWHVVRSQRLWLSDCPRCGSDDLRRSPRLPRDRMFNRLQIPVRRYICPDCYWKGARIDKTRL